MKADSRDIQVVDFNSHEVYDYEIVIDVQQRREVFRSIVKLIVQEED